MARSGLKILGGLTPRQAAFVKHFLTDGPALGNAREAAKLAGYGTEGKWINGAQVLNCPTVQQEIADRISHQLASLDGLAIKAALARIARSDMSNFLSVVEEEVRPTLEELKENPEAKPRTVFVPRLDWEKAAAAGALGEIKEFRHMADGSVTLKLHDPRPAIETLAKIAGLLKERVDVTSGDKPIQPPPQPFDHDRFAELYRQRTGGGNLPRAGSDPPNHN